MSVLALVFAVASGHGAVMPETGTRLHYLVLSGKTDVSPPFGSVDYVFGPREAGGRWWQLEIRAEAGTSNAPLCMVRGLTTTEKGALKFLRYQFKASETNEPLEYAEARSGKALLPPWVDFENNFVPRPATGSRWENGVPETCVLLGQVLTLESVKPGEWADWGPVKRLALDREVLIGTGRSFKDKEGHRLAQTPVKQEYTYVQFDAADYRAMLEAGMNLFTIEANQQQFVADEPVFYTRLTRGEPPVRYPADLYRANFLGTAMFMDEPASVVIWDAHRGATFGHFADVTTAVEKRTREMYESEDLYYGRRGTEKALGVNFGDMRLEQTELPVWETQYDRTFYVMKGGGTGIIHEGRYRLADFNEKVARLAGKDCVFTTREMLEYYYAYLRGGTRPFGKFWGTAIYGQCDPAIAPEALSVAYEMGARYFWFWSSDHGHHVPWLEQLELTRGLKRYMAAHPRVSIYAPQPKRDEVITVPDGWFVSLEDPVWMRGFDKAGTSGESAEYRRLQREVLRSAHEALARGRSLDITIDDGRRVEGYRRMKNEK